MLDKFLEKASFESYEDFMQNFKINVPENFNFGYDVVDAWAEAEPEKRALVWCNDHGEERIFTFTDVKKISNKMCNYFKSIGLKKGDKVDVKNFWGTIHYKVVNFKKVEPNQTTDTVIQNGKKLLTLVTCTQLGNGKYGRYLVICEAK